MRPAMTGVDKHSSVDAWREWWTRSRDAVLGGTYKPDPQEKAGAAGSTTTFYGVPVISTAVIWRWRMRPASPNRSAQARIW